jgi:hypothetical protein
VPDFPIRSSRFVSLSVNLGNTTPLYPSILNHRYADSCWPATWCYIIIKKRIRFCEKNGVFSTSLYVKLILVVDLPLPNTLTSSVLDRHCINYYINHGHTACSPSWCRTTEYNCDTNLGWESRKGMASPFLLFWWDNHGVFMPSRAWVSACIVRYFKF